MYFISCVFIVSYRPTAHFYMYICRILLIQLLGCHIEINACLCEPDTDSGLPYVMLTDCFSVECRQCVLPGAYPGFYMGGHRSRAVLDGGQGV